MLGDWIEASQHFPEPLAMKTTPRAGMAAEERITVDASNRICLCRRPYARRSVDPRLVADLEYAARNAIAPCLDEDERSVGTFAIEVEHLAADPGGASVVCRSRVIHVDGRV